MRFGQYKEGAVPSICQLVEAFLCQDVDIHVVTGLHQTSLEEGHLYCSGGQCGPGKARFSFLTTTTESESEPPAAIIIIIIFVTTKIQQ